MLFSFFFIFQTMQRRTLLGTAAAVFAGFVMPAKAADPVLLGFDEMYGPASVLGITFSDKLKSLNGKLTSVRGFMAPNSSC